MHFHTIQSISKRFFDVNVLDVFVAISILFSLFQSPSVLNPQRYAAYVFPYYLVYFKAIVRQAMQIGSDILFPYYLVYFKARESRKTQLLSQNIFPYYLVYFKASLQQGNEPHILSISILFSLFQSSPCCFILNLFDDNFHTIQSISKRLICLQEALSPVHFHTIQSISKPSYVDPYELVDPVFPYYLVYFKALLALQALPIPNLYFHTIQSISKP